MSGDAGGLNGGAAFGWHQETVNALFFDGASTREYAQRMGVSQRAVIKRRDRILRDLKKFFENSSK